MAKRQEEKKRMLQEVRKLEGRRVSMIQMAPIVYAAGKFENQRPFSHSSNVRRLKNDSFRVDGFRCFKSRRSKTGGNATKTGSTGLISSYFWVDWWLFSFRLKDWPGPGISPPRSELALLLCTVTALA